MNSCSKRLTAYLSVMPATKSRAAASNPSASTIRTSRYFAGLLPHPFPQPAQDAGRLLELGGGDVVLVHGLEQEAAQADGGLEDRFAHPDFGHPAIDRLKHDVGDHPADSLGR